MSDSVEGYRALRDHQRLIRTKYGVECPTCRRERPRANATILLPQQRCRVCGYIDRRPDLTQEQHQDAES